MKELNAIQDILHKSTIGKDVQIAGWVRNRRISKKVVFIMLQDGSSLAPLQVVVDRNHIPEATLKRLTIGCSLTITGKVVASPGAKQAKEVIGERLEILGDAPESYPLQPKRHSFEFLRTIQHLRFRTQTFQAVFRVRHAISYAIHTFFHQRGFYWLHSPLITSVDAEGAGEVFRVTSPSHDKQKDRLLFGKEVFLTVSGQLAGEAAAMGLGKIYTFGPTFRAENSNTRRHLAEFWMVEPEMAFYDLPATIELAKSLLRYIVAHVLQHCREEMSFLEKRPWEMPSPKQGKEPLLQHKLQAVLEKPFTILTYTEAITLLTKAVQQNEVSFTKAAIAWGMDLQMEHERYLTTYFDGPVVVTDYPKALKAFYMRQNEDGKTVAAMDVLLPGIGEVIGGSQREERVEPLTEAMKCIGIATEAMDWYLDTRRFGSIPHSGFGLGLERLVLFITGMDNIRDVIPFPRTPGQAMH